jgi:hypothetical protein
MEKGTEDTSTLVQVEEVKCDIRKLSFVTVLSPVRVVKDKGQGHGVCLTCYCCSEHDTCGKKQEPPVHVSGERPTELVFLQELLKRLQDRHVECAQAVVKKDDVVSDVTVNPDTPNTFQSMMTLEQDKCRAKIANVVALETEKERTNLTSGDEFRFASFVQDRRRDRRVLDTPDC